MGILEPDSDLAGELWTRLAPGNWPIPLSALPEGSALVGGAVRDGLLGRLTSCPDLDLVVPGGALRRSRSLAAALGGTAVVLDEQRDMARLVLRGWTIDFARQEGASLSDDLQRRDYRINAIALPLHPRGPLVDPTGGLRDLKRRQLVAVREDNLIDDPLRLLRGLRLMAEIPLQLDPLTRNWIQRHRNRLALSAPERILAELQRLVAGAEADTVLPLLLQLQLLNRWQDSTNHAAACPTVAQAEAMSPQERLQWLPLARLTQLLSAAGLEDLRASRQLRQRCQRLRHWIQRLPETPETLSEADRYRLL